MLAIRKEKYSRPKHFIKFLGGKTYDYQGRKSEMSTIAVKATMVKTSKLVQRQLQFQYDTQSLLHTGREGEGQPREAQVMKRRH